ncbi:MAG: DNA adenine methylase [Spirochaetia bacterium]|nr:DNA adenine methylase [Spirochaetia bacterium]
MPEWYQALSLSTSDGAFVSTDYLTRQLIAYIGNKRRILGFLYRIFSRLNEQHPITRVLDPFAGSGAVARMVRQMGLQVAANDWEEYSKVINTAHLTLNPAQAEELFSDFGGLKNVLDELNTLQPDSRSRRGNRSLKQPQRPLISRHYAPASTAEADYRTERLFYTRENALFIDLVREHIDRWFPEGGRAHELLLALLLYQAATHVNTSGVFKAYHKGFGGHSRDALGRIMAPMQLEYPVLIEGPAECEVQQLDAAEFLSRRSGDLCYLDPPYNIHQYGSNYHLLNTIARWDFPPVNDGIGADGRLVSKAGIRPDWQSTRSDFCSRARAPEALRDVLEAADARWLVLSYNSEGIIPMEQLMEILSGAGRVEIHSLDYITYRGGRQSMNRRTYNTEFQIVVERCSESGRNREKLSSTRTVFCQPDLGRFLPAHRIQALLQASFVPERLCENFVTRGAEVLLAGNEGWGWLATENLYRFHEIPQIDVLQKLSASELKRIEALLEEAACGDRLEELDVVRRLMCSADTQAQRRRYQKKVLHILKKFTHKKYRRQWEIEVNKLQELLQGDGSQLEILRLGLADLIELGHRRFEG